jgi:replicative DNA helicase
MKRLLRSIIDIQGTIQPENLAHNFLRLRDSQIDWQRPDDLRIYQYIVSYFQSRLEMPAIETVRDFFGRANDIECLERLKDIEAAAYYIRTNFGHLLQTLLEDQNKVKAIALLKEAHDIILKGLEVQEDGKKERRQGVRDGIMHFNSRASNLIIPEYNARTSGDITRDSRELWEEYQSAKLSKGKAIGKLSGLDSLDEVCRGLKRGELHVHAAFPGHLKTTFAINWAYNLVTQFKTNIVYWSLEMPYEQVRRNFAACHSAAEKWLKLGYKPLDYRKIRDGELSPDEEAFYQLVLEDWENNPEHYHCQIMCPDHDVTIEEMRLETELLHKQFEVGFVAIDHGQEVEARKAKKSKDYVVELNSVVRDAKHWALHFNHGEKLPVLMLFQINRQGHDEAAKNNGIYKMAAINYANQVEKSSDVITTSFLDDTHRRSSSAQFCNLKNRDNPIVAPFLVHVDFPPRRIRNPTASGGISIEDHNTGLSIDDA